jgi:hypothetical protein
MSIRRYAFILALGFVFCCGSLALAGDRDRTKDQNRLQDGSCQDDAVDGNGWRVVADDRDRTRDQDRLQDGSRQDDAVDGNGWQVLAADRDRDRTRDRLKDGSCKG